MASASGQTSPPPTSSATPLHKWRGAERVFAACLFAPLAIYGEGGSCGSGLELGGEVPRLSGSPRHSWREGQVTPPRDTHNSELGWVRRSAPPLVPSLRSRC